MMRSLLLKYYEPRGDVRMSSAQKQPIVFTLAQIEWLEKQFPETTMLGDHDGVVYRMGSRHVLNVIKQQSKVVVRHVSVQNDLS